MKRIRIIAVSRSGEIICAFIGTDAVAADAAWNAELQDDRNECAAYYVYPTPIKTRYPARELAPKPEAAKAVTAETESSPIKIFGKRKHRTT